MKIIALLIVIIPSVSACPIGMDEISYGFGNSACVSGAEIRQIKTKGRTCPAGFFITQDKYGNSICSDGVINAYDLSSGCPAPLKPHWDKYGRDTCENNGHQVVELVN